MKVAQVANPRARKVVRSKILKCDAFRGDPEVLRLRLRGRSPRNGLSLLEVILALAILGISMAAISQLFSLGYRSAYQATMRNEANMLADTKMAELAAGIILPQAVGQTVIPEAPNWAYSVQIDSADQPGLLVATLTLAQTETTLSPVTMSVTRFISDPDYEDEK